MDYNLEADMGNETTLVSNLSFNSSSILPEIHNSAEEESLVHLVEKLKTVGVTELFKKLSANSRNCVIAYIVMFLVGAPGNLYVVISVGLELWKRRFRRSSRIKLLIWHLALADLFVTFLVIPVEIFWRLTIKWYGGDALCKAIQFLRTFGLYLSSMVIVCISMDRFCAIIFPMKSLGGMKRVHKMLLAAWMFSFVFASPQIIVFSAQKHPLYPAFRFCTNSHYFPSFNMEILYNLLSLVVMYFAPLAIIIVTYVIVFLTISKKTREQRQQHTNQSRSSTHMRQSGNASQISRAKSKAMWISMFIVTVFVLCWTPYVACVMWYMFDYETAERLIDPRVREALFVTAVSNSCLNPIIYGSYLKRCFRCIFLCGCPQSFVENTITGASSATPATSLQLNVMNGSVGLGIQSRRMSSIHRHM